MEYIKATLEKEKDGKLVFVASDETQDRHGDVIPLDSWSLKNFMKAPRMLVDHDHRVEKIVGRWEDVHIDRAADRPGLKMSPNFHKVTQLSQEVSQMVHGGHLDTVSVGFIPHFDEVEQADGTFKEIQVNELIEVSFVTVPANPNANQIRTLLQQEEEEKNVLAVKSFLRVKNEQTQEPEQEAPAQKEVKKEKGEVAKPATENKRGKQQLTPSSTKGRSLSMKARQRIIARHALKEAARVVNRALYELNRSK